jgi:hypothetical protein
VKKQPINGIENLLSIDEALADSQPHATTDDKLARAIALGELMQAQAARVAELEEQLSAAKADHLRTQVEDLPELLKEIGISMFKLDDGGTVEVKPDLTCGITEANKADAHAWLLKNKFGGLIKTQVVTEFERGDIARAKAFYQAVRKQLPDNGVAVKDAVNPQTLKAFVREQLAKPGNKFPLELFSVRPFDKAVYKPAPVKKSRAS